MLSTKTNVMSTAHTMLGQLFNHISAICTVLPVTIAQRTFMACLDARDHWERREQCERPFIMVAGEYQQPW